MWHEIPDVTVIVNFLQELLSIHNLASGLSFRGRTHTSVKEGERPYKDNLVLFLHHQSQKSLSTPHPQPPAQFQVKREKTSVPRFANYSKGQKPRRERFPAQCHCKYTEYLSELSNSLYETNKNLIT